MKEYRPSLPGRSAMVPLRPVTILTAAVLCFASCAHSDEKESGMKNSIAQYTNALINENSPYLLAHAHNPVNWYPWGEKALQKAQRENKPIFLSVGYSACHWCHVMERESFENEEIAALLNNSFVSIKVDREQRPDLDQIYMAFTQAITGRGGWPMSVFLTPDLKPFFAGTYFPPDDRFGRPGFKRVVTELAAAWINERDKVLKSSEGLFQQLTAQLNGNRGSGVLNSKDIERAVLALKGSFDPVHGGFGNAPKFPHATELSLILRHFAATADSNLLNVVETSLKGMARGGLYDHVGGGFARYSTDTRWLVPHFEKMLYDQGLLLPVYVEAYQITGDEEYLGTIRGTLDFILREMTDQTGGFYSALDADSEGEEGKFYVWSKQEIDIILGEESELFRNFYNVTRGGNFEGHNILNLTAESFALRAESEAAVFDAAMTAGREKLFAARSKRVRPSTDDKILTSWNGLMLTALCKGYRVTGDNRYLEAARKNAAFVFDQLWNDGRLTHSYREGKHSTGEFLEDYAYYLPGLLELYQIDPSSENSRWLHFASDLADRAILVFADSTGRLYLRGEDSDDLILRPSDEHDGARPAPGSLLITSLFKLGRLTGNETFLAEAERMLRALSGLIRRMPNNMAGALLAVDYYMSDKIEIVIVGNGSQRMKMERVLAGKYLPNALVAASVTGNEPWPIFEGRQAPANGTTAFVCRNSACRLPVSTADELATEIAAVAR